MDPSTTMSIAEQRRASLLADADADRGRLGAAAADTVTAGPAGETWSLDSDDLPAP